MDRFEYGKLVDGELQYPPKEIEVSGMKVVGFTEDFLISQGYKKIVVSNPPDDGQDHIQTYTETDVITVTWRAV